MKEIVVSYIIAILITVISSYLYTLLGFTDLSNFINNYLIYILLIYYIITINYLYKKNKIKESKLSSKNYLPLITLGISMSVIFNMIIFIFKPITTYYQTPLLLLIISTGIIGPIFEEILYRYIFYNRLKRKYSIKKSILINSIIFAVSHLTIIKTIYAFLLGIVLNFYYEKTKNIKAPIIIHISGNIIALFLKKYSTLILILAILNFTTTMYLLMRQENIQK